MLEAVFFIQNRFINPSILPLWLSVHLPTFPFECFIFSLTPCQAVWPDGQIISSIFAHWQEWKFAQTQNSSLKMFQKTKQMFTKLSKIYIFSQNWHFFAKSGHTAVSDYICWAGAGGCSWWQESRTDLREFKKFSTRVKMSSAANKVFARRPVVSASEGTTTRDKHYNKIG